jgi:hypothetical protein
MAQEANAATGRSSATRQFRHEVSSNKKRDEEIESSYLDESDRYSLDACHWHAVQKEVANNQIGRPRNLQDIVGRKFPTSS